MTVEPVLSTNNLHERDKNILFYETNHRYEIVTDKENRYTSVTTFIHSHFKKFDSAKVIKNMMSGKNWKEGHKYWGLTAYQISKQWSESGRKEAQAGTDLHYKIECFMNNKSLAPNYTHKDLYEDYLTNNPNYEETSEKEWQYFINFIKDTPTLKPYRTEWMVYHDDLKISGSIDMLYENENGSLSIYDWKRSKEISTINKWNEFAQTECISEMPDSNYWHYALQLNMYKKILENKYSKQIEDLVLIRLHPDAEEVNYDLIRLPDLSEQLERLFNKKK
jgi:hypothetical protein